MLEDGLPPAIRTDEKRLYQVLKNLLSNAVKFTEKGRVKVEIRRAAAGWKENAERLEQAPAVIAFSVSDTGIGIPPDKQKIVFEPFQQADGSTSRKYGGTGLGLSISRELTALMGGDISLQSVPGQGSTFTLYLPLDYQGPSTPKTGERSYAWVEQSRSGAPQSSAAIQLRAPAVPVTPKVTILPAELADDRNAIRSGDRVVLIVEDDLNFARILLDTAHQKGFKGVIAPDGNSGLSLARALKPDGITLDINLPEVDGWTVLDRIKLDPSTRHIPVHIISVEGERERGLQRGALGFLEKPVTAELIDSAFARLGDFLARPRRLLVVEDDPAERTSIVDLIGNGDVQTTAVGSGEDALQALHAQAFDCMVLDLGLPGMSGFGVMEAIGREPALHDLPIVVYTGKRLTRKEESQIRKMAKTIVVKGVQSRERLLDETALFLHRAAAQLPEAKRQVLDQLYRADAALAGRKVLVVDDDVRNLFALTALLERHGMIVLPAETGKDAIASLQASPDVNLALMDLMMPEMDGYDTMRAIRKMPRFQGLPIIALTAKAMRGDREKCIEAGASDYIAKPVDGDQLLSLLRVWLYR